MVQFDGALLRQLVESAGGTKAAAELCGVGPDRVSDWMREGRVRRRHLHRLMRAHRAKKAGVPMDQF